MLKVNEDEARDGFYFVIEERVSETRFGLDESKSEEFKLGDDLSWRHFNNITPGNYLDGLEPDLGIGKEVFIKEWNDSSADIAGITMQKPVRISIHANRILP